MSEVGLRDAELCEREAMDRLPTMPRLTRKECKLTELKLHVPTYYPDDAGEYGQPDVPVLVQEQDGLRIVLGSHATADYKKPDISIERRRHGWAIFLHRTAGDPCGVVYISDDGTAYLHKEWQVDFKILESDDPIPPVDGPAALSWYHITGTWQSLPCCGVQICVTDDGEFLVMEVQKPYKHVLRAATLAEAKEAAQQYSISTTKQDPAKAGS